MKFEHLMVDLETLATTQDAAIISIGAVPFNLNMWPGAGTIHSDGFYGVVDHRINEPLRRVSVDTMNWWDDQNEEARQVFRDIENGKGKSLTHALVDFDDFVTTVFGSSPETSVKLWSHGAAFDIPILEHAYRQVGMTWPFKFWNYRDTRTMIDLSGVGIERAGLTYHNAKDDAEGQAAAMVNGYKLLMERKSNAGN